MHEHRDRLKTTEREYPCMLCTSLLAGVTVGLEIVNLIPHCKLSICVHKVPINEVEYFSKIICTFYNVPAHSERCHSVYILHFEAVLPPAISDVAGVFEGDLNVINVKYKSQFICSGPMKSAYLHGKNRD